MASPLTIVRDINGYPTTGSETAFPFTDTNQYFFLTPNTPFVVTVPRGNYARLVAYFKYFISTAPGNPGVFIQPSATPTLTIPTTTLAATTAELNPSARLVLPGQTLQLITTQAGVGVGISYRIPPQF